MDRLQMVLDDMRKNLEQRAQSSDLSPIAPHGLMESAGRQITPLKPKETSGQVPPKSTLQHSEQDKAELAKTLAIVCQLQKSYGKTPADIRVMVEGFSMVLHDRPMSQIIDAIRQYIKKNSDIPTPACIEKIINPPPPKVDWAVYIDLKRKVRDGNYYLDEEEKRFIRDAEDTAKQRLRDDTNDYQQAKTHLLEHYHE